MLAVRPCAPDHPNAVRWTDKKGKGAYISSKAFCTILYEILGWDTDYAFRVPAILRKKGDESILLFDLDNYIGRELPRRKPTDEEEADADVERRMESDETKGIFFGADDEEPQPVEEMERRLREMAEYEKRNFGTPAFEHNSDFRLTAIDDEGEWDVMAEARALGGDHRVDEITIEALQDEMLEAMIAAEDEDDDEEGGGSE